MSHYETLKKIVIFTPMALAVSAMQVQAGMLAIPLLPTFAQSVEQRDVLATRSLSLENRHAVPFVNEVFADNILLTLSYMSGRISQPSQINWDKVRQPQQHEIVLKPGEVFAYHDGVMSQYSQNVVQTTDAHFNASDGFRSSGRLYGDGVCHLASLFNLVAREAGLHVNAPVNHDFAIIPDISREYGTAIYFSPGENGISEQQNLYIKNTLEKTVTFVISSDQERVDVRVEENR